MPNVSNHWLVSIKSAKILAQELAEQTLNAVSLITIRSATVQEEALETHSFNAVPSQVFRIV